MWCVRESVYTARDRGTFDENTLFHLHIFTNNYLYIFFLTTPIYIQLFRFVAYAARLLSFKDTYDFLSLDI